MLSILLQISIKDLLLTQFYKEEYSPLECNSFSSSQHYFNTFADPSNPFNSLQQSCTSPFHKQNQLLKFSLNKIQNIFSIQFQLQHLLDSYRENPYHTFIEAALIFYCLQLLFRWPYDPKLQKPLTEHEKQALIEEQNPEPLISMDFETDFNKNLSEINLNGLKLENLRSMTCKNCQKKYLLDANINVKNLSSNGFQFSVNHKIADCNEVQFKCLENEVVSRDLFPLIIEFETAAKVVATNGERYLNFAASNFLGIANNPLLKEAAKQTIRKYGVGSCGPRGFYGTTDQHLALESKLANLFNTDACVLYSDGLACVSSVISAFSKSGDLIICDEGCHYFIQQGIRLSRSKFKYFRHNDIEHLEQVLKQVKIEDAEILRQNRLNFRWFPPALNRRFIVCEGLFQNFGDICNLEKIVELKNKYKYRLILDDSYAIGVLSLRGSIDYQNVDIKEIDILCGSLDSSFACSGGFCVGSSEICEYQRLGSQGYCFSASAPPFTCAAAIKSIDLCSSSNEFWRFKRLHENSKFLRNALSVYDEIEVIGDLYVSPLLHIRLKNRLQFIKLEWDALRYVVTMLRKHNHIVVRLSEYAIGEKEPELPLIIIFVSVLHSPDQLQLLATELMKQIQRAISMNPSRCPLRQMQLNSISYSKNNFEESLQENLKLNANISPSLAKNKSQNIVI